MYLFFILTGSNWDNTAHELKFEVIDPWRKQIVYPTDQYIESIIKWERENNSLSNTTVSDLPELQIRSVKLTSIDNTFSISSLYIFDY